MTTLTQAHALRRIAKLLKCEPDEVERTIIDMLDDQRVVGELHDMHHEDAYWAGFSSGVDAA